MRWTRRQNKNELGFLLSVLIAWPALAADREAVDAARRERAKIEEKDFEELSDTNLSQRARLALESEKIRWRHGETDHFVYHFQRITEAAKLAREAEFYYWKIKEDLVVEKDLLQGKSHIIVFSRPDQWQRFTAGAGVPPWSVGFAAGRELFMLVEAGAAYASDRLAHEVTHLVFFRFVPKRIPLWLHEGFAEYQSSAAYAKLKGIGNAPPPPSVRSEPMDLDKLTSYERYPEDPHDVARFYRESERLVRFLITRHPNEYFVPFVNLLADGATFEQALLQTYSDKHKTLDDFQKHFERFK